MDEARSDYQPVPLRFTPVPVDEQRRRAAIFEQVMCARRTVRDFAPDPVPDELIDAAIAVAA